jgi:trimethylamine--corrinoid protein Co-methyltransferase
VGLVPFVGDSLGAKVFSPGIVVYANEIIEQARLFAQGFALDDASVRLEEVAEVGPGGNFLTSPLTLELFRSAYHESGIFPRLTLESWQARGEPSAEGILRSHTRELLSQLEAPGDHAELKARGMAFIGEEG